MKLRNVLALCCALMMTICAYAQQSDASAEVVTPKKEIIKTGLNFGPLPAVAFDADKGFQVGALLNIYNFGDGSTYPNPSLLPQLAEFLTSFKSASMTHFGLNREVAALSRYTIVYYMPPNFILATALRHNSHNFVFNNIVKRGADTYIRGVL